MTAEGGPLPAWLRPLRRWLFDPVPMHSMVICRIGLGSVLFLAYLSRWPLIDPIYGPDGFAGHAYFERFADSGPVGWPLVQLFDQLQHVSSGAAIWALYLALLASSLCFALGVWPRVSGTIALVLHTLFVGRNPAATWGWATMVKPLLLYTILASTGRQASLVTWMRGVMGSRVVREEWTASAWPLRLLQIHISCVFLALWTRIDEASWLSGQILSVALTNRMWARLDIDWFPFFQYLEALGVVSLILELGAPIALWIKPIGKYWAVALMGMFATLVATTSVGWWDFVMLFALSVFLPSSWLQRVFGSRV